MRLERPAMTPSGIMRVSIVAAIVVFSDRQDRTAAVGVRQYVEQQQAAAAAGGRAPTVDDVMRPAVRRSVFVGAGWGIAVLAVGAGVAGFAKRSAGRG